MKSQLFVLGVALMVFVLGACSTETYAVDVDIEEIQLFIALDYNETELEPFDVLFEEDDIELVTSALKSAEKMDGIPDIRMPDYGIDLVGTQTNHLFLWLDEDTTESLFVEYLEDGTEAYYTISEENTDILREFITERREEFNGN
ncbi:hypothetical protein [Alkalicoccobacillus plakortidis]|uniref:YhfM-like domain-containing protein n=1 Tax=Alkalicoccobacillus plakortidis TaxID=444060 RepID=A0ABT0XMA3_9BACI|nr:hypothetical protein [Alkalicoccobacillus plakortidis]MCM2676855.1 hypothetical protein [Alkalicoccobacillus plakortidis]